jgi:hypothetical protein
MKKVPALVPFLIFVFATFIGLLIYTWVESEKANPQMIRLSSAVERGGHTHCS